MAVNPVSVKTEQSNKNAYRKNVSFRGAGFNPILTIMDGIDRGGFLAGFLAQDTLGMVTPRIGAGLYRNKDKTGEYNYKYASLVAVREFLTGPSVFIIPFLMINSIKKHFGKANDVPITYIKGLGDDFTEFASQHPDLKEDAKAMRQAYYKHAVTNVLSQSTQQNFPRTNKAEFDKAVEELTQKLIEMDDAKPIKYLWSPKNDANGQPIKYLKKLQSEFVARFVELKKAYSMNPQGRMFQAYFGIPEKIVGSNYDKLTSQNYIKTAIDKFVGHLRNFAYDASDTLSRSAKGESTRDTIQSFINKRVGSRFLTNFGMTAAVILFFLYIPKIYNSVCKENPELAGLEDTPEDKTASLPPIPQNQGEGA